MINVPKGTKDVLPSQSHKWQYIENAARETARVFNYKEVRTPVFEHTELFLRGVGETTDVVNKEMYTFEDKGGRSITLKPEGTAGVARMFIENGLASSPLPVKTYYITPAFRYERPQAGRLREFHQFGFEAFGSAAPETDAEVIFAASGFLNKLGLKGVKLEINSIGCPICRAEYNKALKNYFKPHLENMCPTCRSLFDKKPLRMLDCKEEGCKNITARAPEILDYLCPDCKKHFERVKELLSSQGLQYSVNSRIVRGLDYYTRTVFEFLSGEIGSQSAVLMENTGVPFPEEDKPLIYLAGMDDSSRALCFKTALYLRGKGVCAEVDHMQRSVKAQLKYADKIGAKHVAVIGETEMQSGEVALKRMSDGFTQTVKIEEIYSYLK